MQLRSNLIYGSNLFNFLKNTKISSISTQNKKHKDQALINVFQDLFQIEINIFKEQDLDDLVSNTTFQNKKKYVSKRKNSTRLIQVKLGLVEKKKQKEILEV